MNAIDEIREYQNNAMSEYQNNAMSDYYENCECLNNETNVSLSNAKNDFGNYESNAYQKNVKNEYLNSLRNQLILSNEQALTMKQAFLHLHYLANNSTTIQTFGMALKSNYPNLISLFFHLRSFFQNLKQKDRELQIQLLETSTFS